MDAKIIYKGRDYVEGDFDHLNEFIFDSGCQYETMAIPILK